jgi:hypothetical protein
MEFTIASHFKGQYMTDVTDLGASKNSSGNTRPLQHEKYIKCHFEACVGDAGGSQLW